MFKLKIDNYICKLSDKIRVFLEKDDAITTLIDKNVLNIISSELGFSKSTLRKYSRNKKYPLFFLKELNKITRKNVFDIIEQNDPLFFSKCKLVKLPNVITPKLAYFVGYLQGDGSIESNKYRINFSDEYLEQIEKINKMSLELFGIKGRIDILRARLSKKPSYRLEIGSVVLNSYLHTVFQVNRGVKKDLRIPKLFLQNKQILKWYLIGLFDADGTLPKNPKRCKQYFIDITFKDKKFIHEIKTVLENVFGIKTLKPYCRIAKSPNSDYVSKTWELRIRKQEIIIKFLNTIGFFHPIKMRRAINLLRLVGQ